MKSKYSQAKMSNLLFAHVSEVEHSLLQYQNPSEALDSDIYYDSTQNV